jgi:hypothetical protein
VFDLGELKRQTDGYYDNDKLTYITTSTVKASRKIHVNIVTKMEGMKKQ